MQLHLFPLNTVLFPSGVLELKIFEPRYLDLVSHCLREESGFGVCLIREGQEVGAVTRVADIGTEAAIVDWDQRSDGLLGITVTGQRRIAIRDTHTEASGLLTGEIRRLPEPPRMAVPSQYKVLAERVDAVIMQLGGPYRHVSRRPEDAGWIADRLAELLPLSLDEKQNLLAMDDPLERLRRVSAVLDWGSEDAEG